MTGPHGRARIRRLAATSLALGVYLVAGAVTYSRFVASHPLSETFLLDFRHYHRALVEALNGRDPYAVRQIGPAFLYPPPSLLFVEAFAYIPTWPARAAAVVVGQVAALVLTVWAVTKRCGLRPARVWWWFPVALGFEPALETIHAGQINCLTLLCLAVFVAGERRHPGASGVALAAAILTKVTPLALLAYVFARRAVRVAVGLVAGLAGLVGLAWLDYGSGPFALYPSVLRDLSLYFPIGENAVSLVGRFHSFGWIAGLQLLTMQRALMVYLAAAIALSAGLALATTTFDALLVVSLFVSVLAPNVVWYHHFTFLLLPTLLWMGLSGLRREIVVWCCLGLLAMQVDRYAFTDGLGAHLFGHASIVALILGQARILLARRRGTGGAPGSLSAECGPLGPDTTR